MGMGKRQSKLVAAGLRKGGAVRIRPAPRHPESDLQISLLDFYRRCVKPGSCKVFAVPNGGERNPIEAARLIAEGVQPGVSDLVIMLPEGRSYYAEVKTPEDKVRQIKAGKQTAKQAAFQADAEALGHRYSIVRSLEEWCDLLVSLGVPCWCGRLGSCAGSRGGRGQGAMFRPAPAGSA